MTSAETDLKDLILASLDGDAAPHRALLERLSRRLRAYYKRRLAGIGGGRQRPKIWFRKPCWPFTSNDTHTTRPTHYALGVCHRAPQADRLSASDLHVVRRCAPR